jgi:DNA repair protein RecN (Recombination protein N)
LAAFGDQHLRVEKIVTGDRTVTQVQPLSTAERVTEMAQMLGGMGEKTVESAEEILANVQRVKATAPRR